MMRPQTVLLLAVALMSSACATIRTVSSAEMTSDAIYVGYWEGECKPILGCGVGDGKVKHCRVNADNTLTCSEQEEVTALLSRRNND